MKKLSPMMECYANAAPADWQPTPRGYLVMLRRLEQRGLVEIRPEPSSSPGRPCGFEWRRLRCAQRRKAS